LCKYAVEDSGVSGTEGGGLGFGRGCKFSYERGCVFSFGRGEGAFMLRVMLFGRLGFNNLICIRYRSRFVGALGMRILFSRIIFSMI
jgi:hypothetical protein